jgi:glycosyltransferase involved in cell wall biosynthesis
MAESGDETTRVPQRPKVLVIAEAANPDWVSVPLVGWSHARALAVVADVHLVTQVRNRAAILRTGLVEGRDFTAVDSEAVSRPLWRVAEVLRGGSGKGWTVVTALSSLSYYSFEHLVWRRFLQSLRERRFDLVHRLTPLSPTTPSLLAARCRRLGIPFVLGPLNGGVPWPRGFDSARRAESEWLSYIRSLYKLLPGYGSTRNSAAAIIVGSRDTMAQLPARHRVKCVYIPENGIDPRCFGSPEHYRPLPPLRVAFIGRLVPYKGADMLLDAATSLVRAGRIKIDIFGDGPQRRLLEAQISRLGLDAGVTLHGWVPHDTLHAHLAQSHVLGFPSVREFGGAVVLEAMAMGLVPVVVRYGGPAELVTRRTGYFVEIGPREAIVAGFRAILSRLVEQPEALIPRSAAAKRRILQDFTWDAKARQTLQVYRWVLGQRHDKPDFGMPFPDENDVDNSTPL